MNFDLTEDEQMLRAVAERFVTDRYDVDGRRAYLAAPQGFDPENWAQLGRLGLIAAPFDEASGGLGASPTDVALIAEAFGRGLVVEPWIESVLVAGRLFDASARPALRAQWIYSVTKGERRLALAHREKTGRDRRQPVATMAKRIADGWCIDGAKSLVVAGFGVDGLIVSARQADTNEVSFFLVPDRTAGVASTPFRLIDGSVACAVEFHGATVPDDHRLDATPDTLDMVETRASVARSAEAVGIMAMLFEATCDHLRTRKQFGAPLASFQALQHRMVTQHAAIEQARALLDLAVMTDPATGAEGRCAIAGARAFIADASITLGHEMIQLHGGMGVTDELAIGHGHKRLVMLSRYPDTAAAALDTYAGIAA